MASSVPRYVDWLAPSAVEELSTSLGESPGARAVRLDALRRFQELPIEPNPLYRKYGYFAGVDLAGVDPNPRGSPVPLPPPTPGTLRVVHDASGTRVELPRELEALGVRVTVVPTDSNGASGAPAPEAPTLLAPPEDRLSALGRALMNRGYRLTVPDGCANPVKVEDFTVLSREREALSVRRSFSVGAESRVLVAEQVFSSNGSSERQRLYASETDLEVGAGAQVAYLGLHAPDERTVSVYTRRARVGNAARLAWVWAGLGGFRTKARNESSLDGQGADVDDLQAFFGAGDQAYDSSVQLTHRGTDTHGQSITRGVFRDRSRGMSRGLVRIEKEARKTISFISEHAMLLSRQARSDTIPILEILCRDVKATHSSSVAPVDPERVFYLESRGFREDEAVRAISEGFLSHVLERAPVAQLREALYPTLAARWESRPVLWDAAHFPNLPMLALATGETGADWRFDSKLR